MFLNYLIVVLVAVISGFQCKTNVPVLIWGTESEELNKLRIPALKKLSAEDFYESVLKKVIPNDSLAIGLFVEESLSLEDLHWEDNYENSVYPLVTNQVQDHKFKTFIPYVNSPVKILQSLTKDNFEISTFDTNNLPKASRNVFLVELDDVKDNEDRTKLLRRHDKVIYETCKSIEKKYGNTICILTASRESWIEPEQISLASRKLLQSKEESKPVLNVYYLQDVGLLYTKSNPLIIDNNKNITYNVTTDNMQVTKQKIGFVVSTDAINLNKSTDNKSRVRLQFNFAADNRTWGLENILLLFLENTTMWNLTCKNDFKIGASFGYSFHTPAKVVFQNDSYTLVFDSLQVELFAEGKGDERFSVAEDTVYFFTIPILSGLFVTSLLVTIVLIGLSMIFDIKTMDLFDDPKGKTVTINASD